MVLHEVFERYLQAVSRRGRSHLTVMAYQNGLRQWQQFCDGQGIDPLKATDLEFEDFTFAQIAQFKPNTVEGRIKAVRGAYKYAVKMKLADYDPTQNVELPRKVIEPPEILTNAQLRAIHAACLTDREYLMFYLLAFTGMRRTEMLTLKFEDIDWDNRELRIWGKQNKFRRIPIHDELWPLLEQADENKRDGQKYVVESNRQDRLSAPMFHELWKRVLDRADVQIKQQAHSFRKTFASSLYQNGVPTEVIDEICGWAKRSVRDRYYVQIPGEMLHSAIHSLYANDPITERVMTYA